MPPTVHWADHEDWVYSQIYMAWKNKDMPCGRTGLTGGLKLLPNHGKPWDMENIVVTKALKLSARWEFRVCANPNPEQKENNNDPVRIQILVSL